MIEGSRFEPIDRLDNMLLDSFEHVLCETLLQHLLGLRVELAQRHREVELLPEVDVGEVETRRLSPLGQVVVRDQAIADRPVNAPEYDVGPLSLGLEGAPGAHELQRDPRRVVPQGLQLLLGCAQKELGEQVLAGLGAGECHQRTRHTRMKDWLSLISSFVLN